MSNASPAPVDAPPGRALRPGRTQDARRGRGFVPLVLAAIVTLVLGGASVAQAVTVPALDAHTDLEFSLDGSTWTDAPDPVLGSWGCDPAGGPAIPDPVGVTGGIPVVDPCAMSPGEAVDRTYHVRNSTDSGRTGRYEVGIGDYVVSDGAEFAVRSTITGAAASDSRTVMLYGTGTDRAADSPARGATVAALELAPGESVTVVDEVSVPLGADAAVQRQSTSPRVWVSFSDVAVVDGDGDGLPDTTEDLLGTDLADPVNRLPDGTVGESYGPERFLPARPEGALLDVDASTLPPGVRLDDGALTGTPTRAGTYDVAFTVTLAGGATYTSVRRVVVHPASGGGSSDLPDFVWQVIVVGVVGTVIGSLGPGFGSLAGSLAGSRGGHPGGADSSTDSAGSDLPTGSSHVSTGSAPLAGGPGAGASTGPDRAGTRQAEGGTPTPREGAPSGEWVRANSDVRGSLATTGVGASELVLWALTAAAAGATLILFGRRRHPRDEARDAAN